MKKVFSRIGLIVLVIAAVLGITGGFAMAGSPPGNTVLGSIEAMVTQIKGKVTSIWDVVTNETYGLEEIKTEVSNISDEINDSYAGLSAIRGQVNTLLVAVGGVDAEVEDMQEDVDDIKTAIADVAQVRNYMDCVEVSAVDIVFDSGDYPDGAHFSVTIYTRLMDGSEELTVSKSWRGETGLSLLTPITDNGYHQFEFDAGRFMLLVYAGHVGDGFSVSYAVTVTSDSAPETAVP